MLANPDAKATSANGIVVVSMRIRAVCARPTRLQPTSHDFSQPPPRRPAQSEAPPQRDHAPPPDNKQCYGARAEAQRHVPGLARAAELSQIPLLPEELDVRIYVDADHDLRVLRRLNRERGQTTVLVTHDPAVAATTDRTIHMVDGLIAAAPLPAAS